MTPRPPFLLPDSEPLTVPVGPLDYDIAEAFLMGKRSAAANEDRIVLTPHFASVVDGATAESDFLCEGRTTGQMAVRLIARAIADLPADADMMEATSLITNAIRDFYVAHDLLPMMTAKPQCRFTASCVIFSARRREIWQIGDCPCLVDGRLFSNAKPIDRINAEARAAFNELALLQGSSIDSLLLDDPGRAFIHPLLMRQALFQNNPSAGAPYAYAAFDGFPVDPSMVPVHEVGGARQIVLASDGYPRLLPSWRESEASLADILRSDPLCFRLHKTTKGLRPGLRSFDDRAYLRLALPERG